MDNEQLYDIWLPEDFEPAPNDYDVWDDEETLQDQAAAIARLVWPNMR